MCQAVINDKLSAFSFFQDFYFSIYLIFSILFHLVPTKNLMQSLDLWDIQEIPLLHTHSCRLSVQKLALQQHLLGMDTNHKGKHSQKTLPVVILSSSRDCCPSPKTPPNPDLLQPVVCMVWAQSCLVSLQIIWRRGPSLPLANSWITPYRCSHLTGIVVTHMHTL